MNFGVNEERLAAVRELVEFSGDLDEVSSRLRAFGWDYNGEEFTLSPHHIVQVLKRFLRDEIDASDIERWANAIEGREDIDFASEQIGEVSYELANPYLTQPLDKNRAQELVQILQKI